MSRIRTLRVPSRRTQGIDTSTLEVSTMIGLTDRGEIKWTSLESDRFLGIRTAQGPGGPVEERYWVGEQFNGMWMVRAECREGSKEEIKARVHPGAQHRTGSRGDAQKVQNTLREFSERLEVMTRPAPIPLRPASSVS